MPALSVAYFGSIAVGYTADLAGADILGVEAVGAGCAFGAAAVVLSGAAGALALMVVGGGLASVLHSAFLKSFHFAVFPACLAA